VIAEIEKTLGEWGYGVTGRQVIFEPAAPDAPRPSDPYISMKVAPTQRVGHDVRTTRDQTPEEGEDVWDRVEGQRTVSVSVNLFRSPAPANPAHAGIGRVEDDAASLVASLSHARWMDLLYGGRLGFNSVSDVRDFADVVKQGWEERRQFDVVFNASIESEEMVERIDSVQITHTLRGESTIEVDTAGEAA
jgi:hypothetical protein